MGWGSTMSPYVSLTARGRTIAALLVGTIVVFVGGLHASNMGFKIVYPMKAAQSGVSVLGFNMLGLPYVPEAGLVTARDLLADIGYLNVGEIDRYNRTNNQWDVYSLAIPVDFPLVPGEGYFVKMQQDLNYKIVGSHDPSVVLHLVHTGPSSLVGQNLIALPYHATAATASELFAELGYVNVAEVDRYNPASGMFDIYSLANPVDFPLVRGSAYFVKAIQDVDFIPSHY